MNQLSIFTDGGSRGNPGPAAYGFVIRNGEKIIHESGKEIGIETNNVAEYSGILESLQWIMTNRESLGDISGIDMFMDSQLACRQLNGLYKIKKAHLASFLIKIREIEGKIGVPITYIHIPREKNKEADRLVNKALDKIL